MPYERKTYDLFISDELRDILEQIKDETDETKYINRLEYYKKSWFPLVGGRELNITPHISSESMRRVFAKYLGSHKVVPSSGYVFVYYKPSTIIDWALLDEDLKTMYPKNHRIDKRGFVYFK
jgi:hypothetical protein